MEPSLSTLHSSTSSTPLEPPEEHKRREGVSNESSSSVIPAGTSNLTERIRDKGGTDAHDERSSIIWA